MSQIKISGLPEYTGNTTGVYVVMNNSGETTTFKVTKETLIGASGTSGTSGTSGDSIFALTGSVWNTTRNVGITGSLNVSGSATITGSLNISVPTVSNTSFRTNGSAIITGSLSIGDANGTQKVISFASASIPGAVIFYDRIGGTGTDAGGRFWINSNTNNGVILIGGGYGQSGSNLTINKNTGGTVLFSSSSLSIEGPVTSITGSVGLSTIMTLAKQATLPTGTTGSLAVSGSSLYFYNGTAWKEVTVAP